jgi:hypothetical protein
MNTAIVKGDSTSSTSSARASTKKPEKRILAPRENQVMKSLIFYASSTRALWPGKILSAFARIACLNTA